MSLRNDIGSNDIVSFWFWGYRGDWRIELQAPVDKIVGDIVYSHYKNTLPRVREMSLEWSFCVIFSRIGNTQVRRERHGGTFMLVLLLEHSSDPSMKSTCAEPHTSWYQGLSEFVK